MKRALLFSGGINPKQASPCYKNNIVAFYRLLLSRGYPKENIRVYLEGGALLDLDGDGLLESCYAATRNDLISGLGWLTKTNPQDQIVLMVTNHGAQNLGIEPWGTGPRITPKDIEKSLRFCQATKLLIFGQCFSGLFGTMKLNKAVICCASGDAESSYQRPQGDYDEFFYYLIGALQGKHPDGSPLHDKAKPQTPTSAEASFQYAASNIDPNRIPATPVLFDQDNIAASTFL